MVFHGELRTVGLGVRVRFARKEDCHSSQRVLGYITPAHCSVCRVGCFGKNPNDIPPMACASMYLCPRDGLSQLVDWRGPPPLNVELWSLKLIFVELLLQPLTNNQLPCATLGILPRHTTPHVDSRLRIRRSPGPSYQSVLGNGEVGLTRTPWTNQQRPSPIHTRHRPGTVTPVALCSSSVPSSAGQLAYTD